MKSNRTIAKREWFLSGAGSFVGAARLYRDDKLPSPIEYRMCAVPLLKCLRGIYGTRSNYRAILTLLFDEASKDIGEWWYSLTHRKEIAAAMKETEEHPYSGEIA